MIVCSPPGLLMAETYPGTHNSNGPRTPSRQARNVRASGHHGRMWLVQVTCSEPDCDEEFEVLVEALDEVEAVVCDCEHCVVVLSVSDFEQFHLAAA